MSSSVISQAVRLFSGHASDLEDLEDVPDVVIDDQGATPESFVIAAAVDDDVEGVDAAILLVDIDLYVISVCHNRLQLDSTYPIAVDGVDEHIHGRDELGADLLDAALAKDLAVDAAAVLLDEVGPYSVLAEWCGHRVAFESGASWDSALEVRETRVETFEDIAVDVLEVASQGSLVDGCTARATVDVDAVADGMHRVSKDCVICLISRITY